MDEGVAGNSVASRLDGDIADRFWWSRMASARHGIVYDTCVACGLLAAATVAGFLLDRPGFDQGIVIIYVLAVQLCAFFTWRRLHCLLSSAAAVGLYSYFFSEPRFSVATLEGDYPGTFVIMFIVSLVSSSIAIALRRALMHTATGTRRTRMVLETNRMLQRCGSRFDIMRAAGTQLARLANTPCVWYRMEEDGSDLVPESAYTPTGDVGPLQLIAPEMPPFLSGSAYVGTPLDATFGGAASYGVYLTVRAGEATAEDEFRPRVLGVFALSAPGDALDEDDRTIADAIVSEAELALDRARALEAREEAAVLAKNEQLRANLLRSISHDLRTPLTSISGNADVLLDQGSTGAAVLDRDTRRNLLKSIRSDALWLNATVENLLAITKLEGGGMNLTPTLELMDDIVEEALRHVSPAVAEHEVEVIPAEEPALVNVDARLMVQLVVNLVNNAVTYTPAGSHIKIRIGVGETGRGEVRVSCAVEDDGPGIAPADRARIFDSFYTVNHGLADGHRSVGLGLSLCKSIADAHGGEISVDAAEPHGAIFRIDLPAADFELDKEPQDA